MKTELRKTVVVKPGGVIEIQSSELREGTTAEVIVRVGTQADRVREVQDLFRAIQIVPAARTITEEEIAAEIEAYRSSKQ